MNSTCYVHIRVYYVLNNFKSNKLLLYHNLYNLRFRKILKKNCKKIQSSYIDIELVEAVLKMLIDYTFLNYYFISFLLC